MLFGEQLRWLLKREAIAPIDLAVHLGVDISLLYRWLRDDRVPGRRSNHVSRIADYLNLDSGTARQLQDAQAYSLSLSRDQRIARRSGDPNGFADLSAAATGPGYHHTALALPRTILGRQEVFDALLTILEQLPAPESPHDLLVFTSQGEDMFGQTEALRRCWRQALFTALSRGWRIDHFVRLDGAAQRDLRLARDLLALLSAEDRYRLCVFPDSNPPRPPLDFLLGPPYVGALLLLATGQDRHSDAAIVIQHPGQVAQLQGYLRQLAATATPVARPFPGADRADYWRALTEIEERPGERWQIKEGLSVLTRPPGWYAEGAPWWRAHGHTAASAALWRRRVAAFERHLRPKRGGYHHRDIIPQQALETYVATGVHPSDLRADGQAIPDTPAERLEHLERLLDLLKSDRYELALVRDLAQLPYYGQGKTNQAALLQVYGDGESKSAGRIDYIIDEVAIANGIAAVFEERWRSLPLNERDKHTIRQVITAKRDALREMARPTRRPHASPRSSG